MPNSYRLSEKEMNILTLIFSYRGLRAKDIAVFLHETFDYTLSNEKSIYNYLLKLKNKGLVKSTRLQGVSSLGSIYYLTNSGLEAVKELLNIPVGQHGNGLLPLSKETIFWDIPTEYQQPPLKQVGHFLQTIECIQQFVVNQKEAFKHQTAYYCNLVYYKNGEQYKVRPDAIVYVNGNCYAVEVDRGTESHEQLVQKFNGYKEYFYYCKSVEDSSKVKPVHSILFVVGERTRKHGIQRRWTNVLAAFMKAFNEVYPSINLILTPVNEVAKTLLFEKYRIDMEKKCLQSILSEMKKEGYKRIGSFSEKFHVVANSETMKCRITSIQVHQEFESRILIDNYDVDQFDLKLMNKIIEHNESLNGYKPIDGVIRWVSPYSAPKFPEGIEKLLTNKEFIQNVTSVIPYFDRYSENVFKVVYKEDNQ